MRRCGIVVSLLIASAALGWSAPAGAEPGDPTQWTQVGFSSFATMSRPGVANFPNADTFVFEVVTEEPGDPEELVYTFTSQIELLSPPWAGWTSLGAPPVGLADEAPTVTSWADNRLDVFAKGDDGQLWHIWYAGFPNFWSAWEPLGGQLGSSPSVTSRGFNTLDVFVRGTDGQLWHKWWDGRAWLGWEPLGGVLVGAPAAVGASDFIEVVARGTDDALWIRFWEPATGWQPWVTVGGVLTGAPANDYEQTVVPGLGGTLWAFRYGEGFHAVGQAGIGGPDQADSDPSTVTTYFCGDPDCATIEGWTEIFAILDGQVVWASDPGGTYANSAAEAAGITAAGFR
jgi:hypothetical protein